MIHAINRSNVLSLIRKDGPISKRKVAKQINVSPTTVNSVVQDLLVEGIVRVEGIGESSGGRKPVLYSFNPDVYTGIAVILHNSSFEIALLNMEGEVKCKQTFRTGKAEGKDYIEQLIKALSDFASNLESNDRCLGISVITPGLVDSSRGMIVYNAKLDLHHIPIKQQIEERTKLKTLVENDTNAFVIAERYFSKDFFCNVLYVSVGEGVGAGILLNGEIYRGFSGSSGEFGHMTVVPGGATCSCGNRGCLENYINWPSVHSKIVAAMLTRGTKTVFSPMVNEDVMKLRPYHFVKAIEEGDELALSIADDISDHLSVAIVSAVHLLNPQAVIVNGEIFKNNAYLLRLIQVKVRKHALPPVGSEIIIKQTSLNENVERLGAISLLLQEEFHFSHHTL
jgi:predicted NBD/HSP70 family sugar kinase